MGGCQSERKAAEMISNSKMPLAIFLEYMHKKFKINRTKIKGGCQSGRKVVTNNSKSDLPLHSIFFLAATFKEYLKRMRPNGISIQLVISKTKKMLAHLFAFHAICNFSTTAPLTMPFLVQSKLNY